MDQYLRVHDNPCLLKDTVSNAIISTDGEAHAEYLNRRNRRVSDSNRIDKLESQLSSMQIILEQLASKLL